MLIIPRETLGETTGDESAMSSKIWIMEELISQPSSTLLQYHFEIIFLNNFVLSFTQSFNPSLFSYYNAGAKKRASVVKRLIVVKRLVWLKG